MKTTPQEHLKAEIVKVCADLYIGEHKVNHVYKKSYSDPQYHHLLRWLGYAFAIDSDGLIVKLGYNGGDTGVWTTPGVGRRLKLNLSLSVLEQEESVIEALLKLNTNITQ